MNALKKLMTALFSFICGTPRNDVPLYDGRPNRKDLDSFTVVQGLRKK